MSERRKLYDYRAVCEGGMIDYITAGQLIHERIAREIPDRAGNLHKVRLLIRVTRREALAMRGAIGG